MPTLEVHRQPAPWRDRARRYKVLVDGQEVGSLKNGETGRFEIPPGSHEISIRIDWGRSPPVTVDLPEGGTARLRCRPSHPSWRALYDITFGRKTYVTLERDE